MFNADLPTAAEAAAAVSAFENPTHLHASCRVSGRGYRIEVTRDGAGVIALDLRGAKAKRRPEAVVVSEYASGPVVYAFSELKNALTWAKGERTRRRRCGLGTLAGSQGVSVVALEAYDYDDADCSPAGPVG